MTTAAFDYVRATSLDHALSVLSDGTPGTKVLAGGHSLLPIMQTRLARPDRLVDIGRLGELRGVRHLPDGRLSIGALTTYTQLMADPAVMTYGLLADALPTIGDVQVRNRGTVGGSIAHADPASDLPACLLALDAEVVTRSAGGGRTVPISEFFTGTLATVLEPTELVTEILLPPASGDHGSAYRNLEQAASGYALAGAAVVIGRSTGGGGRFDRVGIGITGVSEHPYRARAAEAEFLRGQDPMRAAALATDGVTVSSDIHADSDYRTALIQVLVRRAFEAAMERAG